MTPCLASGVYERLPRGTGPAKLAALAATFLASALWHGLQLGFLLGFTGLGEPKETVQRLEAAFLAASGKERSQRLADGPSDGLCGPGPRCFSLCG